LRVPTALRTIRRHPLARALSETEAHVDTTPDERSEWSVEEVQRC
jgi:hypothetical protein